MVDDAAEAFKAEMDAQSPFKAADSEVAPVLNEKEQEKLAKELGLQPTQYNRWQKKAYEEKGRRMQQIREIMTVPREVVVAYGKKKAGKMSVSEAKDKAVMLRLGYPKKTIEKLDPDLRSAIAERQISRDRLPAFLLETNAVDPIPFREDVPFAESLKEMVKNWKDKGRIFFNRETPERNFEDVAGDDAELLKSFIVDNVRANETRAQNWMESVKSNFRKLSKETGIKPGSADDSLVMRYGEKRISLDELKKETPNWEKVVEADKTFRQFYDDTLEMINSVITKYGYDPIPRREAYYTHFQEVGNILSELGNVLRGEDLPSHLNGLTADFKPGKQFFQFSQPRLGGKFTESAFGAINAYLRPAATQIFHTESIQRGRSLENALNEALAQGDIQPTHLTNFMGWLRDYVNTTAGKKSMLDRGFEAFAGRGVFKASDIAQKQVAANMVGGNIGAALTSYIPLTQALATTKKTSLMRGLYEAFVSPLNEANDFVIDGVQSGFLRRRFQSPDLYRNKYAKVRDASFGIFKLIDRYVSDAIVRGKYYDLVGKGMDKTKAMLKADNYASRVIGDRSVGSVPQIFSSRVAAPLTQFQLEVNNQLSNIFKDIPKDYPGLKKYQKIGEVFVYGYLFNELFEKMSGRRPAFDPINTIAELTDIAESDDSPEKKLGKVVEVVSKQLPFTQVLVNGGRMPVFAGIPSWSDIINHPGDSAAKIAATYASPAAGLQIKKSIEGVGAVAKGYSEDKGGNVQYPIDQTVPNFLRGAAFGKYSTPEAREYFDKDLRPLSEKQTEMFKLKGKEYYDKVMNDREVGRAKKTAASGKDVDIEGASGNAEKYAALFGYEGLIKAPKNDGSISAVKAEQKRKRDVVKLLEDEDVPDDIKQQILDRSGFSRNDVDWLYINSISTNRDKAPFVAQKIRNSSEEEVMKAISDRYLTTGMTKEMVVQGLITMDEKKAIDSMISKKTGTGGSKKKKKAGPKPQYSNLAYDSVEDFKLKRRLENSPKARFGGGPRFSAPTFKMPTLEEYARQRSARKGPKKIRVVFRSRQMV
jgi:transcriptional regulator with XRE-family HTH domain